ncbi:ATP-binding protein [Nocardiopsis sediminis]|uniref:ATP-binding protein n=1 Tax=Nocardiopsis sediminis TaxID=1778267 RepID=A0ABV8FJN5_9ACTN
MNAFPSTGLTGPANPCPSPVSQLWTYAGRPALCPQLRRRTRAALAVFTRVVDDAELVVSELFGNACRHTRSGDPDGTITVGISALASGLVLLSVGDDGPRTEPVSGRLPVPQVKPLNADATHHRGLRLVATLSHHWGFYDRERGGRTVWALFAH